MTGTSTSTTHDGRESSARTRPKQIDCSGDSELKEIADADERAWRSHRVLHLEPAHEAVSEGRIEIHLKQDWDGDQEGPSII